jgi:hypothetical protein
MGPSVSELRNRERKNGFLRKLHKEQSEKEQCREKSAINIRPE